MKFRSGSMCTFIGGHKRNTYADSLTWMPVIGQHYKIKKVMMDNSSGHTWLLLEGQEEFAFNSKWFRPGELDYEFVEQLLKSL